MCLFNILLAAATRDLHLERHHLPEAGVRVDAMVGSSGPQVSLYHDWFCLSGFGQARVVVPLLKSVDTSDPRHST